jgi:hypothetical protein
MRLPLALLAAGLFVASLATAQQLQSIKPIAMPAPATAPVQQAPAQADDATQVAPQADAAVANAIDREALLDAQNKKLRESNNALKAENASLKEQLAALTSHGGSNVHAWCPSGTTSRNTAGDEADCAASGNTCEPVSGLCRTTCQSSDMCAGGYTCDVGAQRCVYTAGGVPDSDD